MRKKFIYMVLFITVVSCHDHPHGSDHGHSHAEEEDHLELLSHTVYSDSLELFTEFEPLVKGSTLKIVVHLTKLGEYFRPLSEGKVTAQLTIAGETVTSTANKPKAPGIYELELEPPVAGKAQLKFEIANNNLQEKITIEALQVYPDADAALKEQKPGKDTEYIQYSKEQAWNMEFANAETKRKPFHEIIGTSGLIVVAPDEQVTLSAQVSGILVFADVNLVQGTSLGKGSPLFKIKSNQAVTKNLSAAVQQSRAAVNTAQAQFERASVLVKDRIISEKDYLEAQLQLESAKADLNRAMAAQNFSLGHQNVVSPIAGHLYEIYVRNGQNVAEGTPLVTIYKGNKLQLKVRMPQNQVQKLPLIKSAKFSLQGSEKIFDSEDLNGKVLSYGKSIAGGSPFIPLTFEIDKTDGLLAGSVAEVFLESEITVDALVLPISALTEEQSKFYVYVQHAAEQFEKREVWLGDSNGKDVKILKGLAEGERVVTKGAYRIKLASAAGALPSHGHEH